MKLTYIAHPLRGDIQNNIDRVTEICQALSGYDIVPLSPIHAFGFIDPTGPQEKVLEYCRRLLATADQMWVYGDWRESEGCMMEIAYARQNNIPVRFMEVMG
jgi:hypothetical protein